ncbi:MAG: hypothetical protein AAF768_02355 [Pseudomonadota bacterium]
MRLLAIFTCFLAALLLACAADAQTRDRPKFAIEGVVVVWGADSTGVSPVVSDFIINDSNVAGIDTDLIAGDVASVVTGTLLPAFDSSSLDEVPSRVFNVRNSPNGNGDIDSNGNGVTDGGDVFSAFEMGPNTRLGLRDSVTRSSFYVASNVPFNIDGQALRVVGRGDWVLGKIFWDMNVTQSGNDGIAFGNNAQFPHSGGASSGVSTVSSLFDMIAPTTVFSGDQRTAASPGTLPEQSVRFDIVYTLGSWQGYSLSTAHTNLAEGIYEVEAEVVYTVWVP